MTPNPDDAPPHNDAGDGQQEAGFQDAKAEQDAAERLLGWWQQRLNQWLTDPQTLAQVSQHWLRWQEWMVSQGMTAAQAASAPAYPGFHAGAPTPSPNSVNPQNTAADNPNVDPTQNSQPEESQPRDAQPVHPQYPDNQMANELASKLLERLDALEQRLAKVERQQQQQQQRHDTPFTA